MGPTRDSTLMPSENDPGEFQDSTVEDMMDPFGTANGGEGSNAENAGMPDKTSGRSCVPDNRLVAAEKVGQGVKKLMQTINGLRQLGVEDLVLPLPKIVVVGDQSAGKSSLVEALSEIKVPRSAGTCTRCPLEINLTEGTASMPEWACEIRLLRRYEYTPDISHHPGSPFPHFRHLDLPGDEFFSRIYKKDELGEVLERAQTAALRTQNASTSTRSNAPSRQPTTDELKFSPNEVRLDITGPGLPNLSFYDLPGVVLQTPHPGDRPLVELVRNLLKEYVKTNNSLVLIALPMTQDLDTSAASGLIREMGAEGRCMGVLTKPDLGLTGPPSGWPLWEKVLRNDHFSLFHGYYVTRQPAQQQLEDGISHAEARLQETDFFKNTSPWKDEFVEFSERFGTERLQSALSEKLVSQYLLNLPHITQQVRDKVDEIEAELASIPDIPKDGRLLLTVHDKLNALRAQMKLHLSGDPNFDEFMTNWTDLVRALRLNLEELRPRLNFRRYGNDPEPGNPRTPQKSTTSANLLKSAQRTPGTPTPSSGGPSQTYIELQDSDENETPTPTPSKSASKKRAPRAAPKTPSKKTKLAGPKYTAVRGPIVQKAYTCPEIRSHLQKFVKRVGFSDLAPQEAFFDLTKRSVECWEGPLLAYLEDIDHALKSLISDLINGVFADCQRTQLVKEVSNTLSILADYTIDQQNNKARWLLECELSPHGTLDAEGQRAAEQELTKILRKEAAEARANNFLDESEHENRQTTGADREEAVRKKVAALKEIQLPYLREIMAVGKVQSHYRIAVNRFTDYLLISGQRHVLEEFAEKAFCQLRDKLGLTEPDGESSLPLPQQRCAILMAEDPQREHRRAHLLEQRSRLHRALDKLARLAPDTL
ncbi:MAG: hypothetical protein M1823_000467 [Watsoniomyces obsoletus]|nr:MAG: hypothetical protein M1823_000467 [Watsoniomyces obsoletus]